MQRRLEDRIRHLCTKVVSTDEPEQLKEALAELRAALAEHTHRFREKVAKYPVTTERRSKKADLKN